MYRIECFNRCNYNVHGYTIYNIVEVDELSKAITIKDIWKLRYDKIKITWFINIFGKEINFKLINKILDKLY